MYGLEQNYAQKLLQLAEDKSKCKIWTRSKYDEIVDLMTNKSRDDYYYSNFLKSNQ
jgi:F0F1-type ATP synthase delta subunit